MTVQGPVKKEQPDGMSHGGGGQGVFVPCFAFNWPFLIQEIGSGQSVTSLSLARSQRKLVCRSCRLCMLTPAHADQHHLHLNGVVPILDYKVMGQDLCFLSPFKISERWLRVTEHFSESTQELM